MNDQLQAAEEAINAKILALSGEQQGEDVVADADPQDVVEPEVADAVEISAPEDHDPYAVQDQSQDQAQEVTGAEDFEHKYRVLQGMYRKDVTEVREENRRLTASLTEATASIVQLRERVDALQQKRPDAPDPVVLDEGSLEKYAEFGPEIMDLAKSNLVLQNKLQELSSHLPKIAQMEQDVRKNAESEFFRFMDQDVPNWRAQDADPGFIQWLTSLSPGTGLPWQTSLTEAYQARDAARVAAIFKEYRKHLFLLNPSSHQAPGQAPASGRRAPTPAPASRGGAAPLAAPPQYTLKDWVKLQNEAARGDWNDRPEEYRAKEAAIHAALFPKK